MTAPELAKSRRQLAQLDDRLLRDIGLDRGTARSRLPKASGLTPSQGSQPELPAEPG